MFKRLLAPLCVLVVLGACTQSPDGTRTNAPSDRSEGAGARTHDASKDPAGSIPASKSKRIDPRRGGLEVGFGEFAIALEANPIRPGPVTFVINNGGKLVHGFELKSEDERDSSGPGSGDRYEIEKPTFGPGQTMKIRADLSPGLYEIECYVGNHEERGMRVMLRVRPDAPLVKERTRRTDQIDITGFAFEPSTIEAEADTKLTWINNDPAEHTVTAEDGSFSSETLGRGDRFAVRLRRPGSYAYLCSIHPDMRGTVRVVP